MSIHDDPVQRHYGGGEIVAAIVAAVRAAGKDPQRLKPADLAPVDEFHVRGREATVELAAKAGLAPGLRVIDVGCGLGGSARYLAAEHGCRVTGVDLTAEYVEAARALAKMVGFGDEVEFHQASALSLPYPPGSFDRVWTEHVQMNIADKAAFYGELARVLAPGGRIVFHDVFSGPGGAPYFPVPWAEEPAISHLAAPHEVRRLVEALGLEIAVWEDKSARTREWFAATLERLRAGARPPLGLHILMGPTTPMKFENILRNLVEDRITVVQAVLERPAK